MKAKHSREIWNLRTLERVEFFIDSNLLMQSRIWDKQANFVQYSPIDQSGIGGITCADSSFGSIFIREGGLIDVTFADSSGQLHLFRSQDDGRTYKEVFGILPG